MIAAAVRQAAEIGVLETVCIVDEAATRSRWRHERRAHHRPADRVDKAFTASGTSAPRISSIRRQRPGAAV